MCFITRGFLPISWNDLKVKSLSENQSITTTYHRQKLRWILSVSEHFSRRLTVVPILSFRKAFWASSTAVVVATSVKRTVHGRRRRSAVKRFARIRCVAVGAGRIKFFDDSSSRPIPVFSTEESHHLQSPRVTQTTQTVTGPVRKTTITKRQCPRTTLILFVGLSRRRRNHRQEYWRKVNNVFGTVYDGRANGKSYKKLNW